MKTKPLPSHLSPGGMRERSLTNNQWVKQEFALLRPLHADHPIRQAIDAAKKRVAGKLGLRDKVNAQHGRMKGGIAS